MSQTISPELAAEVRAAHETINLVRPIVRKFRKDHVDLIGDLVPKNRLRYIESTNVHQVVSDLVLAVDANVDSDMDRNESVMTGYKKLVKAVDELNVPAKDKSRMRFLMFADLGELQGGL